MVADELGITDARLADAVQRAAKYRQRIAIEAGTDRLIAEGQIQGMPNAVHRALVLMRPDGWTEAGTVLDPVAQLGPYPGLDVRWHPATDTVQVARPVEFRGIERAPAKKQSYGLISMTNKKWWATTEWWFALSGKSICSTCLVSALNKEPWLNHEVTDRALWPNEQFKCQSCGRKVSVR